MKTKRTKKTIAIIMTCIMAFSAGFALSAEDTNAAIGDYNAGDVAVINNIIATNGLGWTPGNPDSWPLAGSTRSVKWEGASPNKRIVELDLDSYSTFPRLFGTLDVSKLTELKTLYCGQNQLKGLNVSGLTNLEALELYDNQLTKLNVTGLKKIKTLSCHGNDLTKLDLSDQTNISDLNCRYNKLMKLDVSKQVSLVCVECQDNQLTQLILPQQAPLLEDVRCDNNKLTQLDLPKGNLELTRLDCRNNKLIKLDLSKADKLSGSSFNGNDQTPVLTLTMSTPIIYTLPIQLNGPAFTDGNISYASGILISTSPAIASTVFTAQTGNADCELTGELTLKYQLKKTTGLKVTPGKKKLTVSWKRDKGVTGYELVYAKNAKFTKGKKTITIKKNSTVKKTIKKLKKGQVYYVKVRAYKTVGKTKIYGAYSKTIKKKVK